MKRWGREGHREERDENMAGKRPDWEQGRSLLHKDEKGSGEIENPYGHLGYFRETFAGGQGERKVRRGGRTEREGKTEWGGRTEREERSGRGGKAERAVRKGETGKEGFRIEAKEAPGTPVHTEKEKYLEPGTEKRVFQKGERFLFASELPFRKQAIFYDVTEKQRSREFLECMKEVLEKQGHPALSGLFGFLEQAPERVQKQALEQKRMQELTLEEFDRVNHRLDHVNDQIRKKEREEEKLRVGLQQMIDRAKEEKKDSGWWTRPEKGGTGGEQTEGTAEAEIVQGGGEEGTEEAETVQGEEEEGTAKKE